VRLTPRDTAFYDLFTAAADNLVEAVRLLAQALPVEADRAAVAERLRTVERAGDELTHEIVRRASATFVPPFDRGDIYRLASGVDDVLDEIEAAVDQMVRYRVDDLPSDVPGIVAVLQRAAELTAMAMPRLRTVGDLREYWVEVNRLENEGDRIYRRVTARLFSGEFATLEVLRLKDVVDTLKRAVDHLEGIANTVETIALKEA
jgi:predicted phosphate transport protein (TIGR00153 family)